MQILIPLAILFVFFWFFVLLPQRRRRGAHTLMQDELAPGDEVITAGGLHGEVREIDDTVIRVEIAPGTIVRVDRRAIAARVEPDAPSEPEAPVEPDAPVATLPEAES